MSVENLTTLYTSKDYEQFVAELKTLRPNFVDNRYPDIVHDIVLQIDHIIRYYSQDKYQHLDLVAKNLLGMEKGKYQLGRNKSVVSLKEAMAYNNTV